MNVVTKSSPQTATERPRVVGLSNVITVAVILTMSILQVLRREVAPLGTLGVIVANIVTKALKQLVKRTLPASIWRRPEGSRRDSMKDPGFPSSHTSNMTFISVYFALYLGLHLGCPFKKAVFVAILPSGAMAAARIWDKDHTIQQTLGGVAWGCCMGLWWALIGPRLRGILEWAQPQPWALVVLCFGVTCLSEGFYCGCYAETHDDKVFGRLGWLTNVHKAAWSETSNIPSCQQVLKFECTRAWTWRHHPRDCLRAAHA